MTQAQREGQRSSGWRIVPAGDAALLVRLGSRPGPSATRRVLALVAALDAAPPPGLLDAIPAYASVLVRFDPLTTEPAAMSTYLRAALAQSADAPLPRGRIIHIPVHYGGDDGPDLDDVACLLGMSAAELIQRHAAASYRVTFLGFLAGFPYLAGLPRALAVPRLATPRTRVPAGSVAIAERQAGVYPVASPGGWRILGRTTAVLFDPERDPPSLLRPSDRVRFYPVAADDLPAPLSPVRRGSVQRAVGGLPWLRVVQPGIQTTVQDGGRVGYARYGVSASGAADPDALALGNALLANPPGAATLEITGAASFEALGACVVAVTGAPCSVAVNGRRMASGVAFALAAGDILEIGAPSAGLRIYLAVAGGVAVPLVMGSSATDLSARIGGLVGRTLRADDELARGPSGEEAEGRILPLELMSRLPAAGAWRLRILTGPHDERSPGSLESLLRARFTVDARSDRIGVRLRRADGPCLEGGQTLSEGLPRGAVQLPPDGEPVLLLADAQATGGYCVPAVVISADLWRIGQLRPGDTVRFELVALDEALTALRRRREEIVAIQRAPMPARLIGGFAEWSDGDDD